LHHALGLAAVHAEAGLGTAARELVQRAAAHFQRAWTCDPRDFMAGLNRAEALLMTGANQAAVEQARAVLGESRRIGRRSAWSGR
jgi:hypothetical protein